LSTDPISPYFDALERRHLANLTRSELTRALRALSSCYVERREKLAAGHALEGAGKRAAFALFYGSLHLITISEILRAAGASTRPPHIIHDLGCGTGVGGAAWALACDRRPSVTGIDRNAWTVAEANWTYAQLGVRGRAKTGDAVRDFPKGATADTGVMLAYAANELPPEQRTLLLDKVSDVVRHGARLVVVEPIARRDRPWWPEWAERLTGLGARHDEWRFPASLPQSLRQIAKSAGLDPRELTARTILKV
jgi:SAM-dependent methyltransferase